MKILNTEINIELVKRAKEHRASLARAQEKLREAKETLAVVERAQEQPPLDEKDRERGEQELHEARHEVKVYETESERQIEILRDCEPYYLMLRRRFQTDPIFAAHVLGYTAIEQETHGPMFAVQVKPDPDKDVREWDEIKEGINLDPRGTFKSTCSIVGSVQCVVCYPDIRICKQTATKPLAKAIVNEIGGHFELAPHQEPTLFHLLFPEFTVRPEKRPDGEYTAPCRTRRWREATVMGFSIETSMSGWHFDVLDPDDPVDASNSSTPSGVRKTRKQYRLNKKTLMPYGYVNYKGTVYDPNDLGRDMILKAKPGRTRVLVRGALVMKNGGRLVPGMDFPAQDEITLLFPKLLTFEFLKKEFDDDPESFITQYMNDAYGAKEITFRREDLLAATLPQDQVPPMGQTFVAFRLPHAGKAGMEFLAGAAGVLDGGRMFVTDVVRGSFSPSQMAQRIVSFCKTHGEHTVMIEETPGARHLEQHIRNYAAVHQWPVTIQWLEFEEDDAVRATRLKSTEPLIVAKRLLFADNIGKLTELYRQFCEFGIVEQADIVDVVGRVACRMPASIVVTETSKDQALAWELMRAREMADRLHGQGRYAPPDPSTIEVLTPAPNSPHGLEDCLGGVRG